jgi:hypothetical protein
MQIKTTLMFYLTRVRMAIISNIDNNECWKDEGERNHIHCWWECKLVQPLWKVAWRFLKKLKIDLPYDRVISLMGIYPKECKPGYNVYCSTTYNSQPSEIEK